jgi:hypothetical protein
MCGVRGGDDDKKVRGVGDEEDKLKRKVNERKTKRLKHLKTCILTKISLISLVLAVQPLPKIIIMSFPSSL